MMMMITMMAGFANFSNAHCNVAAYKIVLIRHGESEWNLANRFTGWYDAKLTDTGKKEAKAAGAALKEAGYQFDVAHTSVLSRAFDTLDIVLEQIGQKDLPIEKTWRLNERHQGALTGLNKSETAEIYGETFDIPPPPMEKDHPYYDNIRKDERYKNGPSDEEFPDAESLKMTMERSLPYWNNVIVAQMKDGKKILVVAHENLLCGLVKHLDSISDEDIMGCSLPNGIPFVYELDEQLKPVVSMQFVGDEETVKKTIESVAAPGNLLLLESK